MDTICAISTAPGVGGIGIVRISGKETLNIINKMFKSSKNRDIKQIKSHTLNHGYIIEYGQKVDEVLVSIMLSPNTYTKEDVAEINCHGGIVTLKKILGICLKNGARMAEPGEFTKRAFLNGRIDLAQAEAVIDIINSKTNLGMEKAFDQLEGHLSIKIKEFKDQVLQLMAHLEASIDFPEHDIEEVTFDFLNSNIENLIRQMDAILEKADKGKIIREGISTAIIGKPNVGKSSLLNVLLKENRAIVTEVPGTTRDIIEEYINLHGIPLKIIDTAGIRETQDLVEKIGVKRTKEAIDIADLVILVLDNSQDIEEEDISIAKSIVNKKVIIVINKIDLKGSFNQEKIKLLLPYSPIIRVSVKEEISIEDIEETIKNMFFEGLIESNNDTLITNARHKDLLQKSKENLVEAQKSLNNGMPIDCVSIDLKNALENLGSITGDHVGEEIINEIFKSFCVGK